MSSELENARIRIDWASKTIQQQHKAIKKIKEFIKEKNLAEEYIKWIRQKGKNDDNQR